MSPRIDSQASSGAIVPPVSITVARRPAIRSSVVQTTPPIRSACPPMYFVAECST